MKVREIMTKEPASCASDISVAAAAEIMWKRNCGFLPITGAEKEVLGVVTDRDMYIAVATRNQSPGNVAVKAVSSGVTYSCRPNDDVYKALETMVEKRVRRLPVIDPSGKLVGILSTDDVVLHADAHGRQNAGLSAEEVISSLRKLYVSQLRDEKPAAESGR
jgi:CBS domain-containing protein